MTGVDYYGMVSGCCWLLISLTCYNHKEPWPATIGTFALGFWGVAAVFVKTSGM